MGFVLLNLVGNISVMFYVAIADIVIKLKKLRYKYRVWRFRRNLLKKKKQNKLMTDQEFLEA
jgi:hypothetical protein